MRKYAPFLASVFVVLVLAAANLFAAPTERQAETIPSWLYVEPGWAQACATGGGCIPMTKAELEQLVAIATARAIERCKRDI